MNGIAIATFLEETEQFGKQLTDSLPNVRVEDTPAVASQRVMRHDAFTRALVGLILGNGHTRDLSASNREVLAHAVVLLLVQVGLDEDKDLAVSGPVPLNDLLAKAGDVGRVQPHICLCTAPFFGGVSRRGGSTSGLSGTGSAPCVYERWSFEWPLREVGP